MSVGLKVRTGGLVGLIAFFTVLGVVPANALADGSGLAVNVVRGAIATATVEADEAGLVTGPAAPAVDLVVTTLGAAAWLTAPLWVPWAQDQVGKLFGDHSAEPQPTIQKPTARVEPPPTPPAAGAISYGPTYMLDPPKADVVPHASVSAPVHNFTIKFSTDAILPSTDQTMGSFNALTHWDAVCETATGGLTYPSGYSIGSLKAAYTYYGTAHPQDPNSQEVGVNACGADTIISATIRPMTKPEWTAASGNYLTHNVNKVATWTNPNPPAIKPTAGKVVTATQSCARPDGSIFEVSADSPADDASNAAGFSIPSCTAADPTSHGFATTVTAPHYPGASAQNIWQTRPTTGNYPDCDVSIVNSPCVLSVKVDGQPCTPGAAGCVGWTNLVEFAPSRVECDWGKYILPLSDCDVLERAYEPDGAPATKPNTDGDPATWDGPRVATDPGTGTDPTPTGAVAPGPDTGANPSTSPSASPGSDPSASPSASPTVGGGTVTDPEAPGAPNPNPAPDPNPSPSSGQCFPTGWAAFNPVEWVMKPVQCALSWAFVPKTSTITKLNDDVGSDVKRVGFGPISDALGAGLSPLGNSGGCQGPAFTFNWHGTGQTFYPLAACSGSMALAASVTNAFSTVVFIVGGGLAFLRAISSAFGYKFAFGPRGGGDA